MKDNADLPPAIQVAQERLKKNKVKDTVSNNLMTRSTKVKLMGERGRKG